MNMMRMIIKKSIKYRTGAVILSLAFLILFIGGCAKKDTAPEPGFELYFVNSAETGLYTVPYTLTGTDVESMVNEVTEALKVPSDKLVYKTVIGNTFDLVSVSIKDNQLVLGFDARYRNTDPLLEVLSRASLVRSYGQIPGIDGISFTVEGEPLTDQAGNPVGIMTPDQFITNAGKEINAYEKVELTLFFASETGDRLVKTTRSVIYNTNISPEKLVVDELIKGPSSEYEGYPVLDPAAKALSVTVNDGTCYVNMDPAYLSSLYPVTDDVLTHSIANSLIELGGINKVQISVDNTEPGMTRDNSSLTGLFERNLDIVE
ncbi:MAG: GerMN domain-containing protein [Lachnospiraceae bacterium]|nr:GerMN domain-containing protein [Lachnospiraceae bacterium]